MKFRTTAACCGVFAISLTLGGCLGGGQGGGGADADQTVRASVVTAPADLQLLCASEAASRFDAASDSVLPVGSRQAGQDRFEVDLSVDGEAATCVVDDDANIISLQRGSTGEA